MKKTFSNQAQLSWKTNKVTNKQIQKQINQTHMDMGYDPSRFKPSGHDRIGKKM